MSDYSNVEELPSDVDVNDGSSPEDESSVKVVVESKGEVEKVDIDEETSSTADKKMSLEDMRLAGYSPLTTIFRLSVGPILSQFTGALYGIITTIWVSKAIGDKGMAAISTMNSFDGIGRAFGFFVSTAASAKISQLFGEGKSLEAAQVVADLYRICIICGLIVAIALCPSMKPAAKWFGANEEIVQMSYEYILPLSVCAFSTVIYLGGGGMLQGEGRSLIFGISNVVALFLNMFFFAPIFLFCTNWGIQGASIATIVSEAIPGFTVLVLFFMGKFAVKPQWSMLLKKFSPHTFPALKVGVSQLIANLSVCIPSILVRKFIGDAAKDRYNDAMAGFNATIRFSQLTVAVNIAITMGFLPAGSYAYAAHNFKRYLKLAWNSVWLNFVWGTLTCIFTWSIPREMSKIFSSTEGYLEYAAPMMRYCNGLAFICGFKFNGQTMMQSLRLGGRATFTSFMNNLVSITGFSFLLYYTNKNDAIRMVWAYPMSQAFAFIFSIILLIRPLHGIYASAKLQDAEESEEVKDKIEKDEEDDINMDKEVEGTSHEDVHEHEEVRHLSEI